MANFVVFLQCQQFLAQINNPKIGEDSKIFYSPDSNVQTDFTLETEYYLIGSAACCLVSQIIKKSIDLKVIQNCQNRILGWSWKIRKKEAYCYARTVQDRCQIQFEAKEGGPRGIYEYWQRWWFKWCRWPAPNEIRLIRNEIETVNDPMFDWMMHKSKSHSRMLTCDLQMTAINQRQSIDRVSTEFVSRRVCVNAAGI